MSLKALFDSILSSDAKSPRDKKEQQERLKRALTVQQILAAARNATPQRNTYAAPSREDQINELMVKWLGELSDPKVDPFEYLLQRIAEATVDSRRR